MYLLRGGKCEICTTSLELYSKEHLKTAHIDHCHKTGEIRGLLCSACNRGIGYLRDSPELLQKAIDYLRK